jgi:hypothetical protein
MDFRRLSLGLGFLGLITLASGFGLWLVRMPALEQFRGGYSQCLWSPIYQATRTSLISDWLGQKYKGQGMFIDNNWDPDNAPCDIAKDGWRPRIQDPDLAQREIDAIMRGVKFIYTRERSPIFFTSYFLNGVGLFLLVLAGLIFFATPRLVRES